MPGEILGLFGVNALDTSPHLDGDGVLIVGELGIIPQRHAELLLQQTPAKR